MSYGIERALKERGSAVIVPTGNSMRPLLWPDQDSVALEARAAYQMCIRDSNEIAPLGCNRAVYNHHGVRHFFAGPIGEETPV